MAVNNYTWNDPSLWVKNSSFSETSPEGKAYSSMVSNGSGNRIALTAPLPLPASTFTVYAASGFQISLLYFKQDDTYLGPTNGKPLVWQTAESGRTLTRPANAEKFAVFLRRGTGSAALLPADVAEAGFYIRYEYELVGSAMIDLTTVVDVASCTRYYLLQSSTLSPPAKPTTKPPAGSWNDTEPTYTSGSTNSLYFCDLTVFSDGTWSYSSVSRSSSYEAAKEAYNRAIAAGSTASAAQTAAIAAQQAVDSLQVGGRNLYIDSTAVPGYLNGSNGSIIAPDRYNKTSDYINVTPGEQYVAQIWAEEPGTYQPWWCLQWFDVNKTFLSQAVRTVLNVEYTKQVLTAPSGAAFARFGARYLMAGNVQARLKLEKGNRATDWTPAPEDVYADIAAVEGLALDVQESADMNTQSIQRLDQNVSGLSTQFNVFSSGIEATIEDHSEILSAMSFSTEGLKVQMAGSIYYTLTDDVGYHIYQNDKEIAAFSEGKGSMEQLQMGGIICRKTSKGGWVWTEVGS